MKPFMKPFLTNSTRRVLKDLKDMRLCHIQDKKSNYKILLETITFLMIVGTGMSIPLDHGQQEGTVSILSAADFHHV